MMSGTASIHPPAVRDALERRGLPVDPDPDDAVVRLRASIAETNGERTGRLCLRCFNVSSVVVDHRSCPFCGEEF